MATIAIADEVKAETAPLLEPRPYRMTVDEYFRLGMAGVLVEEARVYLWEGRLVEKMTVGPARGYTQAVLNTLLVRRLPEGWHVRPALPVVIGQASVPEPDFSIARGRPVDHQTRTPWTSDVALAIEVSDSSLAFDSGKKRDAYGAASIPVYWVVNLPESRIDVYTKPTGPSDSPTYLEHRAYMPGEDVPMILDGREVGRISVSDVI